MSKNIELVVHWGPAEQTSFFIDHWRRNEGDLILWPNETGGVPRIHIPLASIRYFEIHPIPVRVNAAEAPPAASTRPRRGGKGPSGEELLAFAAAYMRARSDEVTKGRPLATSALATGISVATACRWRFKAAEAGLLDELPPYGDAAPEENFWDDRTTPGVNP